MLKVTTTKGQLHNAYVNVAYIQILQVTNKNIRN
jgi:hypothetical protein